MKMEISKDDLYFILQKYDDGYRNDLSKTMLFLDKIFDEYHREKEISLKEIMPTESVRLDDMPIKQEN